MPQPDSRSASPCNSRPDSPGDVHPVTAALAPVLALPILEMARFRRLMNYEGWEVDLARMCVDTAYAHQCLATAHTSSDERLRMAALHLFAAYDRNAAQGPVLH